MHYAPLGVPPPGAANVVRTTDDTVEMEGGGAPLTYATDRPAVPKLLTEHTQYYDLPAGLMVPLVRLEDNTYQVRQASACISFICMHAVARVPPHCCSRTPF